MTDGPEYLYSDLVDVGAADLAELGSLDPKLLAASLAQVLHRVRRPAEAIAGYVVGEPKSAEFAPNTVGGRDLTR